MSSSRLSLTVAGSNLYWIDGQAKTGGKIETVPITGGTPKPVVTSANLAGQLATDGTKLYYIATLPTPGTCSLGICGYELDSVGFDGTGQTTIFQFYAAVGGGYASNLFVVGANAYFPGKLHAADPPNVIVEPLVGGTPTYLAPGLAATPGFVVDLPYVDASGAYFEYENNAAPKGLSLGYVPLTGGASTDIYDPVGYDNYGAIFWGGDFTGKSGSAYFVENTGGVMPPYAGALMKVTAPGQATKVAGTVGDSPGLIGDANGAFLLENGGGGDSGIFRIDLATGAVTPFYTSMITSPSDQIMALDAQNLYFATPGYTLWAQKR